MSEDSVQKTFVKDANLREAYNTVIKGWDGPEHLMLIVERKGSFRFAEVPHDLPKEKSVEWLRQAIEHLEKTEFIEVPPE